MKRRYGVILLVVLVSLGLTTGTAVGLLRGLTGHWAAALVTALESRGIVGGDEQGRFHPDSPLTRAQVAKLFVLGMGFEQEAQLLSRYPSRFIDVSANHWGRGYIESLAETGVTEGYPDQTFGPDQPVTRAQMAVLLVRAAGLSSQAEAHRSAPTTFQDDAEIPSWARGELAVALQRNLLTGLPDGTFRPNQLLSRAEGATILLRLLSLKGSMYHLTGTMVRFDPETRTGVVRDQMGQEQSFAMSEAAQYFRNGTSTTALAMRPLDQVWIVLGNDGRGIFMEARFKDLLGNLVEIDGHEAVLSLPEGSLKLVPVDHFAAIYLNGRPARLQDLAGAGQVYVLFDSSSGSARVVDAIKAPIVGEFIGDRGPNTPFVALVDDQSQEFNLAPDARIFLDGRPVAISQLTAGDRVQIAVDSDGRVTFLQAER